MTGKYQKYGMPQKSFTTMRKLLFLLLLSPVFCLGQQPEKYWDFEFLNDTVFYNGKKIVPGDTLFLGWGSGPTKDFLFIVQVPKKEIVVRYLDRSASNAFMVFNGVRVQKAMKQKIVTPIFYVRNDERNQVYIDFKNASLSGEVKNLE